MSDYKRRFGDRSDGRRLRTVDPFFYLIPHIMERRSDAQTFFDEKIDLTNVESFLKEMRESGIKNIGFLHIVMAAMVRTISQKPAINRFVAGKKIFARNGIYISLAVKKQLIEDSPETTIKLKFEPTDTIYDVVDKLNNAIFENKKYEMKNGTDNAAKLLSYCPSFILGFVVRIIKKLDFYGILHKKLIEVSPFHTSVFITDLGSLGIQPVYHHIYDFGTTSAFVAFGIKQRKKIIDKNNNIVLKKYINIRVVTDERIVDGHYYANAFKLFNKYISNPQKLTVVPEKVYEDIE